MRKFKVTINGDKWLVRLLPHSEFRKHWPRTEAVTEYNHAKNSRELVFSDKFITKSHVVHEVLHAHFSYCDFVKKSYGIVEEDICEYLDSKLQYVVKVSNNIFNRLKS